MRREKFLTYSFELLTDSHCRHLNFLFLRYSYVYLHLPFVEFVALCLRKKLIQNCYRSDASVYVSERFSGASLTSLQIFLDGRKEGRLGGTAILHCKHSLSGQVICTSPPYKSGSGLLIRNSPF